MSVNSYLSILFIISITTKVYELPHPDKSVGSIELPRPFSMLPSVLSSPLILEEKGVTFSVLQKVHVKITENSVATCCPHLTRQLPPAPRHLHRYTSMAVTTSPSSITRTTSRTEFFYMIKSNKGTAHLWLTCLICFSLLELEITSWSWWHELFQLSMSVPFCGGRINNNEQIDYTIISLQILLYVWYKKKML